MAHFNTKRRVIPITLDIVFFMRNSRSSFGPASKIDWTDELVRLVAEGHRVSVDFWNTLVIETMSRDSVRLMVCTYLIDEFGLKMSEKNLYENFNRVANGLKSVSKDFGYDEEYKLYSAWYYSGVSFFRDEDKVIFFANRAIEIEIKLSFMNSTIPDRTLNAFNSIARYENLIVISDFEGDSNFLRQLAMLHGLMLPDLVLVSSEYLINKRSSRLFKLDSKLDQETYHFGDNLNADILGATLAGIRAIQVQHVPTLPKVVERKRQIAPRPLPSFKNDKQAASYLVSRFSVELKSFIKKGDKIFFLGSEGAFLSNAITHCEETLVSACINKGRRFAMVACLESQTAWVVTRYLQESVNLQILLQIIGVNFENIEESTLAFNYIVSAESRLSNLVSDNQVMASRSAKMRLASDLDITGSNQRLVLVDIGYRGTFAQSMKRLFDCEISVVQVFGNDYELRQNGIESHTIFNEECGFYFWGAIPIIESIFAAGPRASVTTPSLTSFQRDLWESNNIRIDEIDQEVARLIHWPSKSLIQLIKGFTVSDDFSQRKTQFFDGGLTFRQKITRSQMTHYHFGVFGVLSVYLLKELKLRSKIRTR
jgi:FMN phosphatase YigB (HAD superfamily)